MENKFITNKMSFLIIVFLIFLLMFVASESNAVPIIPTGNRSNLCNIAARVLNGTVPLMTALQGMTGKFSFFK